MKSKPKKSRSAARFPLIASRLPTKMTAVVKT